MKILSSLNKSKKSKQLPKNKSNYLSPRSSQQIKSDHGLTTITETKSMQPIMKSQTDDQIKTKSIHF